MCGIAGVLNLDGAPVSQDAVGRMASAVAHRGPDGQGVYCKDYVGLGHRRLAILDLSPAGRQPMTTEDGRFVIVYNGEIYNFRELRKELEALGHNFVSRSDTEAVLLSFAQWGPSAVEKFNGMFAFAIWDNREKELFLARDRYGMKPLHYTLQGKTFLFGSEIKSMLAHGALSAELDKSALVEYFTFQNLFTDGSLFKGVKLLQAGCFMTVSSKATGTPCPRQYRDYQFEEPEGAVDEKEVVEELDRLFVQAVNRQLVSDVEVGAYLSGGMDSGSITAVAARSIPYIKTFTAGFDLHSASGVELGFDEREKAEHMSHLYKTEHYEMVLKAGDMERAMRRMTWHMEEPRVGQSYPNFYISGLAGKFVKVALTGAGGDELFGGYPWRYYRAVVNDDFENYIDKYYRFWQRLIPNKAIKKVFKPIEKDIEAVWTRDIFRDVFKRKNREFLRPEDYINHSLYFEARTFLHGLLLVEDKLSMAHGLEIRAPFLDNDLVDFAMRIPVHMKLGALGAVVGLNENEPGPKTEKYFNKTRDGKLVLRKVMERYAPPEITNGVKQGFCAPDATWFKGESIDYLRKIILNDDARIYEYMDKTAVQALINEHLEGKTNRRLLIWSLLSVEKWLTIFIDQSGEPQLP